MVKLIFTRQAKNDLKSIHAYIAKDSPVNAKRFIEQLVSRSEVLKIYSEIGHLVFPNKFKNLRQLLHKSYRIVYNYADDVVTILTIHHQSRLVENVGAIKKYKEE